MLRAGIIGLPNAGKSTLFNSLTASQVPAEAYPFTTIDPNIGVAEVPDARLDRLFEILSPPKAVPAVVEFVDIAGLVAGAHRGEGLGNRFLGHIREVQALIHVVRTFDDPNVAHPHGAPSPARDVGVVHTELLLADLESVQKRLATVERVARSGDRNAQRETGLLTRLVAWLNEGRAVRSLEREDWEGEVIASLFLLTDKPELFVANASESALTRDDDAVRALRETVGDDPVLVLCCKLEAELPSLEPADRAEYMAAIGLGSTGLESLVRETHRLLGLITFFTFNEKEVRAWTLKGGSHAPAAAGVVHSDFEQGFIRADTIGFDEFERAGSLAAARDAGLVRSEGRDYLVEDGDIMWFRAKI